MDRNDPLLPFAFSTSSKDEKIALNTDPRDKYEIDQNASSMYHTRSTQRKIPTETKRGPARGPVISLPPSFKRKMGDSFTEKDNVKRLDYDFFVGGENLVGTDESYDERYVPRTESRLESSVNGDEEPAPKKMIETFPSSPPIIDPASEFEIDQHDVTIPDSPVLTPKGFTLETSPIRRQLQAQSSEADFGIDSFNRFKFSTLTQHPSTDHDVEAEIPSRSSRFSEARAIILQSFEDISPFVSLAHMQLDDIPDEIKDLNNLVIFPQSTQVMRQLYLNNNNLRVLNPNLFEFTNLNVLSLRHNKLVFIPSSIEKLKNLRDLNISINKLRHLPPQILNLPCLHTFRAGPNPFIEVDSNATQVDESDSRHAKGLRWISSVVYKRERSTVTSLKALCLDAIARYDVTYRETKYWKNAVPKLYHPIIALAISKGHFKETCNECDLIVVESYAKVYEWWQILQNNEIPIKRRFCSEKCVAKYCNMDHKSEHSSEGLVE